MQQKQFREQVLQTTRSAALQASLKRLRERAQANGTDTALEAAQRLETDPGCVTRPGGTAARNAQPLRFHHHHRQQSAPHDDVIQAAQRVCRYVKGQQGRR